MKTIIINERTTNIPVVDVSTGMDVGLSSIPLFFRDTLKFAELVINTQDEDGCPAQLPVRRKHIVAWNSYAISVEPADEALAESDFQLSPDTYAELIGVQLRSKDDVMLGKVQTVSVDLESGELLSLTGCRDGEEQTFDSDEILSIDDSNTVIVQKTAKAQMSLEDLQKMQEQLMRRLEKIEALLGDIDAKLNQRGRKTPEIPRKEPPRKELPKRVAVPDVADVPDIPDVSDVPDIPHVVEKLVLKSQSSASPMQSVTEGDRIRLTESCEDIFAEQDEEQTSGQASDYEAPVQSSVQTPPLQSGKKPERKKNARSKLYWKSSGSQVLGMALFVAATAALSFFRLL